MAARRFSQVYREKPAVRGTDSERARKRFARLLFDIYRQVPNRTVLWGQFADGIQRELGVDLPYQFESHDITAFLESCALDDFLDSIGITFDVIAEHPMRRDLVPQFVNFVGRVFDEENLSYRIDEEGQVHFRVDAEFESGSIETIGALSPAKFNAAKDAFQRAREDMQKSSPDLLDAMRSLFESAESTFKTLTNSRAGLNSGEVRKTLLPLIDRRMANADPIAKGAATRLAEAFADWVNACHPYRHGHNQAEAPVPTTEIAIALMASGAAYIRWLATLDQ